MLGPVPAPAADLELRGASLTGGVVMAIVNRTTDSFYAPARFPDDAAALAAVAAAAEQGAQIVDVGGVRAGVGPEIGVAEEIDRVIGFVELVRAQVPGIFVSVDTWRSEVAEAAVRAGADLLNDTWAGHDPALVEVAGRHGVGVVCSHTGGLPPRTDPHDVVYPLPVDAPPGTDPEDGVVLDVLGTLARAAARAVACGVPPASVLVDPTHDFGKTTANSLRLVRRADALVGLGYPVLMALSRKDFVGETLDLPVDLRLEGTLAATAVAAWLGVRVFRTHDVVATRRVLDLVGAVRGEIAPRAPRRGL